MELKLNVKATPSFKSPFCIVELRGDPSMVDTLDEAVKEAIKKEGWRIH